MATLVRWEPFREATALQSELSRFMSGLLESNGPTQAWVPPLDVWETDSELVLAFDLPGIPEEKVSVEVEDGSLTVRAEREQSEEVVQERFHRVERRFGSFSRTIGLPQGVNEDSIDAQYRDGVLEIRVPKPEAPKPRRIQVGSSGREQPTIDGTAEQKQ
jgi:HSP20 family protein